MTASAPPMPRLSWNRTSAMRLGAAALVSGAAVPLFAVLVHAHQPDLFDIFVTAPAVGG